MSELNHASTINPSETSGDAPHIQEPPLPIAEMRVSEAAAENPYARFQPEQLEAIKLNVVDSIGRAVQAYDVAEVLRAGKNLFALQRELDQRKSGEEVTAQRERTRPDGMLNLTSPEVEDVASIIDVLKDVDSAARVSLGISNTLGREGLPQGDQASDEAFLQTVEVQALMHTVGKGLKEVQGEFNEKNPYSAKTNEELLHIAANFAATISELTAKGKHDEAAAAQDKLDRLVEVQARRKAVMLAIDSPGVQPAQESAPSTLEDFKADVQKQVRAIHEQAQVEGRELTEFETQRIKEMAASVRRWQSVA